MVKALKLPLAGYRDSATFYYRGFYALLWSSTQFVAASARGRLLHYGYADVHRSSWNKSTGGFSVRCIRD